jgi:glycosyltransferase involved in cell wall biosynthesis
MSAARSFLNRATLFSIANSRAVKRSVVHRYGLRPGRVAVIPNFVSMPRTGLTRDEARRRIGIPADAFTVVATGSISAVKDYPTIIKAVAAMRERRGNVTLVVAGGGKGRSGMVSFAQALGLDGSARFLGAVEDVQTLLAAADVFVHASRSEGMSNAVLEAMSAGLPVVASDIPANREALGDGCGEFFEPGDWAGCLKGLDRFADDTAAAIECGRKARERVRRVFDCGAVIARRERIYRRLAEVVNGTRQQ